MKIILSILCMVLMFHCAAADQRYSQVADYANPNNQERLALTNDDQIIILYGNDKMFYAHRSYNLKPLYTGDFINTPVTL